MINLDPAIIDQEKVRKTRRKQLFKFAIIPLSLLVILSAVFLRPGIYNILMSFSYNNKNYSSSASLSKNQSVANPFEVYLPHYNEGVSNLHLQKYSDAEANFEKSADLNPPDEMICKINVNLSYSIEKQADALTVQEEYLEAITRYNIAMSKLYNDGCLSDGLNSKDANAEDARDRIEQKIAEANRAMNGTEGNNDSKQSTGNAPSMDDIKEVIDNSLNDSNDLREMRDKTGKNRNGSTPPTAPAENSYHW